MQALPNEGAANLYEAWRKPGLSFLHRPERPEQAEARGNLGRLSPRLRGEGDCALYHGAGKVFEGPG